MQQDNSQPAPDAGVGPATSHLLRDTQWKPATVVENKADSADGTLRTLVLSVEDHVTLLDGRKVRRRPTGPRWIDSYKLPGQFVGLRCGEELETLLTISSSPYDVRRESSLLDAALIEVLVDRHGDSAEQHVAELGPGALVDVSEVVGDGYSSLFNDGSGAGLQTVLEEGRPLLLVCAGHRGIAPMRACIEWTPVQAHATASAVALVYAAPSAAAAAYLSRWDDWRASGVHVTPCYQEQWAGASNGNGSAPAQSLKECLDAVVFGASGGLAATVGGAPKEAAVLVSGLPGDVAAWLTKRLTSEGVDGERIMYNDYF